MDWFTPIISAVTSLGSNIVNWFSKKNENETNQEINQANIDYNTKMTQQSWERDDTAHQREVADLEAAGLSPLANTTGTTVTAPLGAPSPLAMQAPQIDSNGLINAVLRSKELDEEKRHNYEIERQRDAELLVQAEQVTQKSRELDIQNKKVQADIRYQADLISNELKTIEEAERHNKEEEYLRRVEHESEEYWKEIKQQVPGDYTYQDIYDFDIYKARMKLWNLQFQHFMENIGATQKATAKSTSENTSVGGSIGATVQGSPVGANIGANGSQASSESSYDMENLSEKQKQMLINFYNENPKPVYHRYKWESKK